ncbi:MAG: alpha/beta hydrolase [Planctomycetes bacterium]|nr:alpha/beta hydrolase [Planctomycetota bacterium]
MSSSILTTCVALVALASNSVAQVVPTHSGLVYATLGSQDLKLDLYLPAGGTAPSPVFLYIHGGGWSGGSRFPIPGPAELALQQGFAVAALDYRLTSQAALFAPFQVTFPAQIHDVKGAVRWLRANAATYGLDPARFVSFGTSAGGHLSALLATSGGVAALEGDVGGNLAFSSAVQAAADFFGPTDLLHMDDDVTTPPGSTIVHEDPSSPESKLVGWDQPGQGLGDIKVHLADPTPPYPALVQLVTDANPITWVDAGDPPMFIGHGTHDVSVAVNQSTKLSAALFAHGVAHDYRAVPGAGHGLGGPIDSVVVAFASAALNSTSAPVVGTDFCFGDGSAKPCPCGNVSQSGARLGCRHSAIVGANLNAVGVASVSSDSLLLRGDSLPNGNVLFFQGLAPTGGGTGLLFGDGLLCIGSSIERLGAKTNVQGWSSYPQVGNPSVSAKGGASAGQTLYYQVWFRDVTTHCTPAQHNLTNAVAITWLP